MWGKSQVLFLRMQLLCLKRWCLLEGDCEREQLGICGKTNGKDTILDVILVIDGVKSIQVKRVDAKTAEIKKK